MPDSCRCPLSSWRNAAPVAGVLVPSWCFSHGGTPRPSGVLVPSWCPLSWRNADHQTGTPPRRPRACACDTFIYPRYIASENSPILENGRAAFAFDERPQTNEKQAKTNYFSLFLENFPQKVWRLQNKAVPLHHHLVLTEPPKAHKTKL